MLIPPATGNLPKISVVVPSFNQASFLEDCLLSILGQGYPDLEVLVLDGGSTDGSREILARYAPQLTFCRSEKDAGQGAAINEGFARATGEIFCWLNSDDLFLPGTLLDVGRRLAGQTASARLLYGACMNIHTRGSDVAPFVQADNPPPFSAERLTREDFLVQPSCFWTRALSRATGVLDESLHYVLDWDWFIRASRVPGAQFVPVPRHYSIYRHHPDHKSGGGHPRRLAEVLGLVDRYATDYWQALYRDVADSLPRVQSTANRLRGLGKPWKRRALAMAFPSKWFRLRHWEDFGIAASMCV